MSYILFCLEIILLLIGMYYLSISLFSLTTAKKRSVSDKLHSYALIVAAHNEERVIAGLLNSLAQMYYPAHKYKVFVVADNCTDSTADIARAHGATVLERFSETEKGKGYALEHAFAHIFENDDNYDYIAVFDADNTVAPDFLTRMNETVNQGYRAVQGYLDSKNPYDSWVTFSYSLWYWLNNRSAQLSRGNLGIGCRLGGTGLAIETQLIKEYGWGATCLAEDTEFTLKLALNDIKVGWSQDAVVYDEKPIKMEASWNQRTRWVQGLADVGTRFIRPLLKKGLTEKKAEPIHMVMNFWSDTLVPICLSVFAALDIFTWISLATNGEFLPILTGVWMQPMNFLLLNIYLLGTLFVAVFGLYQDKKLSVGLLKHMGGFILYLLSWIPIGIVGCLKKNNKEWYHTPHVVNGDSSRKES